MTPPPLRTFPPEGRPEEKRGSSGGNVRPEGGQTPPHLQTKERRT